MMTQAADGGHKINDPCDDRAKSINGRVCPVTETPVTIRPTAANPRSAGTGDRQWKAATLLAAASAAVYAWLAVGALSQAWVYGLLLFAVAGFEALLAHALYLRASPRTVLAGVVGNLGVISAYVVSRTAGLLPIDMTTSSPDHASMTMTSHGAGVPDYSGQFGMSSVPEVGALDLAVTVGLLGLVVLLVALLLPAWHPKVRST